MGDNSRHVPQRVVNRKESKEASYTSRDEEPSNLRRTNEWIRDLPPEHPRGTTSVGDGHSDGDDLEDKISRVSTERKLEGGTAMIGGGERAEGRGGGREGMSSTRRV